jgi:hypothetical protein
VNGRLVQTPDHWVDLERDAVTLDGKPYGDPQGRPTVYDLVSG